MKQSVHPSALITHQFKGVQYNPFPVRSVRLSRCAVPLYDSLGESSVEYIIDHSEASIVFTSTQKFPLLEKTLHVTKKHIKTIVYFGDVTEDSKRTSQAAEKEVRLFYLFCV